MLAGLAAFLAVLLIAVAVLKKFANKADLDQAVFTYQIDLDKLGHLGKFAPFSLIPTILGITLGLWWNELDRSLKYLQPYVSMSRSPTEISRGAGVTYESSHWLWAAIKAAKNKHWLLSLVTLGTLLAQTGKAYNPRAVIFDLLSPPSYHLNVCTIRARHRKHL